MLLLEWFNWIRKYLLTLMKVDTNTVLINIIINLQIIIYGFLHDNLIYHLISLSLIKFIHTHTDLFVPIFHFHLTSPPPPPNFHHFTTNKQKTTNPKLSQNYNYYCYCYLSKVYLRWWLRKWKEKKGFFSK